MVTGNIEIKYGYLLDPCFQLVGTGGRPLTNGWIEVYIAGTRNKYYCSSDFAGTLHPFKIPLDSLGSNIILADVEKSYDVYVYNRFGNLAMSRYNITPGKGGAGGSISGSGIAEHWIGKNGQTRSIPAGTDTALKLPLSYEYEGSFIDRINENRTAFYLKEGLYLVQAVVNFKQSDQDLTNEISQVDVFTRYDDAPEDMSFNRDMAGPDSSDDSHCLKVSFIRCVKEDDEVSQIVLFKVNTPNAWSECYLQNVQIARLSSGGAGAGGAIYTAGDYIAIDDETNTISVTGIEPENYATHDEVEQAIESATSAFITSADLPDLSSYATEQWVLDKHYITSADIPDIPDDLVTSAELSQTSGLIEQDIADLTSAISESLADKMDKSSSADFYPRYDNPEGYLTSIPSEYVTESEMSGYVQGQTSSFITSADLPDVSDMATQTWVTEQHYITSADVPPQIEYSAGDNIDITDHVVSVTDTSLLLAGENVSITPSGDNYVISAQVPETSGYVTEQEMNDAIQSATSAFLTSADLPDTSDMATKTWVGEQGYLTSVPSEYITETELAAELSGKADTSAIPSVAGLASETYVDEHIEAATSGKADKSEIPSLVGYATEQYVTDHTSAFITSADLPDVSDMATQTWVSEQGYLTSVPSEYVTDTELESELSGKADTSAIPDVSNFVTQEDIDAAVSGKMDATESSAFYPMATNPSGYLTSADVDMSDYIPYSAAGVTLENSNFKIDTNGQAYKGAGSSSVDLPVVHDSNTQVTINGPITLTQYDTIYLYGYSGYQNSSFYLIFSYMEGSMETRYEREISVSAGSSYVTLPAFNPSDPTHSTPIGTFDKIIVDAYGSGYSLQNLIFNRYRNAPAVKYATVNDLSAAIASGTSGKQDTLTFGYDESDKINAINGSAIAGGGSVPEGVMVESAIQYNAVGEISGYGESAIAQYGAEKQWLVHDDTIVHMSNSAQYAFGVNLSATSQLMGLDETVLFSSSGEAISGNQYITLSESLKNFDRTKIYYALQPSWGGKLTYELVGVEGNVPFCLNQFWYREQTGYNNYWETITFNKYDDANLRITNIGGEQGPIHSTSWTTTSGLTVNIYKVVGIGRKQSN